MGGKNLSNFGGPISVIRSAIVFIPPYLIAPESAKGLEWAMTLKLDVFAALGLGLEIFRMPEEEGVGPGGPDGLRGRFQAHGLEEVPHAQAQHQLTGALPVLAMFRPPFMDVAHQLHEFGIGRLMGMKGTITQLIWAPSRMGAWEPRSRVAPVSVPGRRAWGIRLMQCMQWLQFLLSMASFLPS